MLGCLGSAPGSLPCGTIPQRAALGVVLASKKEPCPFPGCVKYTAMSKRIGKICPLVLRSQIGCCEWGCCTFHFELCSGTEYRRRPYNLELYLVGSPQPSHILSPLQSPFSSSMITWETGGQSLQDCSPTTTHHPPRSTIRWYVLSSLPLLLRTSLPASTQGGAELGQEPGMLWVQCLPGPCICRSLWIPPPSPPSLKP